MRGEPISTDLRKIDVILIASHWDEQTDDLLMLRLVERRDKVWGNEVQRTPDEVVKRIREKCRVFTGEALRLAGNYRLIAPVGIDDDTLTIDGKPLTRKDPGLPVY